MPSATPQELQFIVIDDFSPGIWADWFGGGGAQPAPLGAAQQTGTAGCVVGTNGELVPGPLRVNRLLETLLEAGGGTNYPAGDENLHITSFKSLSPILDHTGYLAATRGNQNPFPDQLFFGFEYYYTLGGGNYAHKFRSRTYKMWHMGAANPAIGTVPTFDILTQATGISFAPFVYGFSSVDFTRANPPSPASNVFIIAVIQFTSNRNAGVGAAVAYPSNATPAVDSSDNITGLRTPTQLYALLAHQQRVIGLSLITNNTFGTNAELPYDGITCSAPNDYTTIDQEIISYVNENPGGYGSWYSNNASQLIFIKQQHGGYILSGPVTDPTIIALPGLPSTGDAVNIGCVTQEGAYIYGSRTGAYAFHGGDTAEDISPQLDGWFWKAGSGNQGVDNFTFTKGSFASYSNYVFAPNNWIYDIAKHSWWRLTPPGAIPYTWMNNSVNGLILACPSYVNSTQNVLCDWYDIYQGQTSYTWRSQPLKESGNRLLEFREIDLKCLGTGNITVTINGLGGATQSETFAVAQAFPLLIEKQTFLQAHDAFIDITSTGTGGNPAPKIISVALGFAERATAR